MGAGWGTTRARRDELKLGDPAERRVWEGRGGTYGGGDVVVGGGCGDEADEEAALADGRVPDEQDLEGAVVAAGPRRRAHGGQGDGRQTARASDRIAGRERSEAKCGVGWW